MFKKLLKSVQGDVPAATDPSDQARELVAAGNAAEDAGRLQEALGLYRRAVALAPQLPAAHLNLGIAQEASGDAAAARACYERVLAIEAGHPFGAYNLGKLDYLQGRLPQAQALLRLALARRPEFAEAWVVLASVLEAQQDLAGAVDAIAQALRLRPDYPGPLLDQAGLLRQLGRIDEAEAAAARAASLVPDSDTCAVLHAELLVLQGRSAEALLAIRRAITLAPQRLELLSRELFLLHMVEEASAQDLWQRHRAYGTRLEAAVAPLALPAPDRGKQRLRLGLVSEDFRTHPVALFLRPLLEHLDRARFEVFGYSSGRKSDHVTGELRALCAHWTAAADWDDARLAAAVAADGIDILLDLGGHTGASRLGVFAARPAPLQASWLGYLDTTGLTRIDVRLTDERCDPPAAQALHSERLLRFPASQWCYRPFLALPPAAAAPCERNGFVTFGSLNSAAKLTPQMAARWGRILQAMPGARLLVVDAASERKQRELLQAVEAAGAKREQVEFAPRLDLEGYYRFMDRVDIALDSYPYGGGTTTFDALWMGVPVLAAMGPLSVSRSAASVLAALGLDAWIAPGIDAYEAVALRQATDVAAIGQLRRTLRGRLQASPLMDEPAFARAFQALLEAAWLGAAVAGRP